MYNAVVRRARDPDRQRLYESFGASAAKTIAALLAAANSPGIDWVVHSLRGRDAGLHSALTGSAPVRCSLVPRAGLGAFTAKADGSWLIGVHEHAPQILSAFAALVVGAAPRPDVLDKLSTIDTRQTPTSLLDISPEHERDDDAAVARAFSDAAVMFLMSHEFGHVLLGHEAADGDVDPLLAQLGLPAAFSSALEEIEADGIAALLLARLPEQSTQLAVVGARVFFELSHLVNTRRLHDMGIDSVESYLAATHPHPALRLATVQAYTGTRTGPPAQFVQNDIDAALGRAPLAREPEAISTLRSLSEDAPAEDVRLFMNAMQDQVGRRLDGQLLEHLLTRSPERAIACAAFAAVTYTDANPYRWASPQEAIAFGAMWSRFKKVTNAHAAAKTSIDGLIRRGIPELDEILALQVHTVHWVHT